MAIARSKVRMHVLPRVGAMLVWLLIWGGLAGVAWTGWEVYGVYQSGFSDGVAAGEHLAVEMRVKDLRAGSYTNRLGEFKRGSMARMPKRTWADQLYRHSWESGVDSVVEYLPH